MEVGTMENENSQVASLMAAMSEDDEFSEEAVQELSAFQRSLENAPVIPLTDIVFPEAVIRMLNPEE
jgi:hypothetical protein